MGGRTAMVAQAGGIRRKLVRVVGELLLFMGSVDRTWLLRKSRAVNEWK